MQRLRSAEYGGQPLQGDTGNIVQRLLRRERDAGGLRVESHEPAALLLCAKTVFHQPVPDLARGAKFGDLFKEVAVRVEEVTQARAELIDVKPAAARPFNVLNAVIDGEGKLLQRGGTGFTDVIAADGNGIEFGRKFGAELKGIDHQAHGRPGRV